MKMQTSVWVQVEQQPLSVLLCFTPEVSPPTKLTNKMQPGLLFLLTSDTPVDKELPNSGRNAQNRNNIFFHFFQ